jgi:type II secretory pathway component PulK
MSKAAYCSRRGAALVVVLVGLAVATVMFLAAMKQILVQKKTIALNSRQIQAGWLAESGAQRAAARLAADANYRGETWSISAEELEGRDGGTVTIRVAAAPGKPDRRAVHVEADYPSDPQERVRETRDIVLRTGLQP